MKRILLCAFLTSSALINASAHLQGPITEYVQSSKTVCIAKAIAIDNGTITFQIEEIIKGEPPPLLKLAPVEVPVAIIQNSEWLLAATGSKQDSVGWALKGDHGWVNAPIRRVNGEIRLAGNYGCVDGTLRTDNRFKPLTLGQLRDLAKQPPPRY